MRERAEAREPTIERADTQEGPTDIGTIPIATIDEETGPVVAHTRLVCVAGPDLGRVFRVRDATLVIGRAGAIRLQASDVSRSHARIKTSRDGTLIEDLGSANGTYVNGVALRAPSPLRIGDRIQLGSAVLVYTHHDDLAERVRQLQKLDSICAAVSGLAHDFNNALQTIVCGLDQLGSLPEEDERTLIGDMKIATAAATGLAKRMQDLGRPTPAAYNPVDVAVLIEDAVRIAGPQIEKRIAMSFAADVRARVRGSQGELQQVVVNLLINARDAIAGRGEIEVRCGIVRLDRATACAYQLPIPREKAEQSYVELAVRDTGCGMDDATLARIFEPFFTTKTPTKGTGLGLAVVHSIVRAHGGAIDVQSRPGKGTTVRVLLPRDA